MHSDKMKILYADGKKLIPRKQEALRYMGCKSEPDNEEFRSLYDECAQKYMSVAEYKCVYRITGVSLEGTDTVVFDFCTIKSESLFKNMSGCSSAIVLAATTGIGVDNLLRRYRALSPAKAVITDCIASSGIEVWCDEICRQLAEKYQLKPRFSPGYGGVSLEHQRDVFAFLDVQKRLGITLNDALMMIPVKSVTAFVGIKKSLDEKIWSEAESRGSTKESYK